ncbi:hypothetical protein AVEN_133837-1 [Araneus ventricosus]|uniref:Uncharacterized protein n=1 Tax=Araneus ventricosus TaxID=182803 RepID=A0A4Y2I7R0_ARAVE|nr:hypothetical protein AVEN_133837-1 [Araneus ventricosus]
MPPHPGGQGQRVGLRVPSGLRKPGCDLRPKITSRILLFGEFVGGLLPWEIAGPETSQADELRKNYVSSKTSALSLFTPGTEHGPNTSSKKRKQFQIYKCHNKTMNIFCDCKRSVCCCCTSKEINMSVYRNCKKEKRK